MAAVITVLIGGEKTGFPKDIACQNVPKKNHLLPGFTVATLG